MFYDTAASHRLGLRRKRLFAVAFQPWQMFSNLMVQRRARARLSRLGDYTLKDIGISRGSIHYAIRDGRSD